MTRYLFWLLLILLVILRYISTLPKYIDGQRIRLTAKVTSEPIKYETSQYVKVASLKTYLPLYPEVNYGDTIIVEGTIENINGTLQLENPELVKVERSTGVLYKVQERLISFYQRTLPEPHASLIAGVTIGSKASIPNDFWEKLKNSGTAHVVVASGMNVTLVAGFLLGLLITLIPRRKAVPLALGGVWVYALLSGFDAPIIRAAIMGTIALTAQEIGRVNIAWRALFLSAAFMLIIWPHWVTDVGFILSFTATASLIALEKKVASWIKKVPFMLKSPIALRQDLSTTLAAQIGVAPILFLSFGQFNFFSPLINTAILWTIVPITVVGMLAGIISLIFEPLGKIILYLIYPLTLWFVSIINLMSNF